MRKTWLWWSSGKDSAWSLHLLARDGAHEVTGLVTTVDDDSNRVAVHAVRTDLLQAQAAAAGCPLQLVTIPHPCPNERYEEAVRTVVAHARSNDVRCMAFGDLHLEDIRAYRERLFGDLSMDVAFPLWGLDTAMLASEMIEAGLHAWITCVDRNALPAEFAGRAFDDALLAALPEGVDPCGENGEFHTFADAGPMFSRRIAVEVGRREEREGFVYCDLMPAGGSRAPL